MSAETTTGGTPPFSDPAEHAERTRLGPDDRDIAGRGYPYDITAEARDRWDMCVLLAVQKFYPYLQVPRDPVVAQEAAMLFRTDLPLGPEHDIRELLAGVREAGGPIEYLEAAAEADA